MGGMQIQENKTKPTKQQRGGVVEMGESLGEIFAINSQVITGMELENN